MFVRAVCSGVRSPDTVGVGIIGLGFMGATHLRAYADTPGCKLVGVCDGDPSRLSGRAPASGNLESDGEAPLFDPSDVVTSSDPEPLLRDDRIDLLSICTPTDTHVDLAIRALDAGKHVLVEKPVAISSGEVERLLNHARPDGPRCVPAMCVRYWPGWDLLPGLIHSGAHGRVLSARFERLGAPPGWSRFYADTGRSGDALFDLHIHDVDMVHRCFGAPTRVRSYGRPGHAITMYRFDDGPPMVQAEGGWLTDPAAPFRMRYRVEFEGALAEFDLDRSPAMSLLVEGEDQSPTLPEATGWEAQARAVVEGVRTGSGAGLATLDEALQVTRTLESERESLAVGRDVDVPHSA